MSNSLSSLDTLYSLQWILKWTTITAITYAFCNISFLGYGDAPALIVRAVCNPCIVIQAWQCDRMCCCDVFSPLISAPFRSTRILARVLKLNDDKSNHGIEIECYYVNVIQWASASCREWLDSGRTIRMTGGFSLVAVVDVAWSPRAKRFLW